MVVLIDREQGARATLAQRGLHLHAALTLTEILRVLRKHDRVDEATAERVRAFVAANQTSLTTTAAGEAAAASTAPSAVVSAAARAGKGAPRLSYAARAALTGVAPAAQALFETADRKRTNLCVALDVPSAADVVRLANLLGPKVCCIKTHCDIHADWDPNPETGTGARLAALAARHDFLLFEDRKFADIGNTSGMQAGQLCRSTPRCPCRSVPLPPVPLCPPAAHAFPSPCRPCLPIPLPPMPSHPPAARTALFPCRLCHRRPCHRHSPRMTSKDAAPVVFRQTTGFYADNAIQIITHRRGTRALPFSRPCLTHLVDPAQLANPASETENP